MAKARSTSSASSERDEKVVANFNAPTSEVGEDEDEAVLLRYAIESSAWEKRLLTGHCAAGWVIGNVRWCRLCPRAHSMLFVAAKSPKLTSNSHVRV